jgi:hypothetical protein
MTLNKCYKNSARREFLMKFKLAVCLCLILLVIFRVNFINDNELTTLNTSHAVEFLESNYHGKNYKIISSHKSSDNLSLYSYLLNVSEGKVIFAVVNRISNQYVLSHENIYEQKNIPIDTFELGGTFRVSLITINDKKIEKLIVEHDGGLTTAIDNFQNKSVYFNGVISIIYGLDINNNTIYKHCVDYSTCVESTL